MKRTLFGVGAIVLLFAGMMFWGRVSDAAYNEGYVLLFMRGHALVVTDVGPELEQRLWHAKRSGSVSGKDFGFSWASWHHGENGPYYYRFENLGERTVYARSRLFTKLIGSTRLQLAPKQVIYFGLVDDRPSTWLTERVNVNEYDSLLASTSTGTSMTLVMPIL